MPTTSWPARFSRAAVTELSTPPDMATTMRAAIAGPSGALLEPSHLDGLEDLLVGLLGIVGEARQILDPLPEIGEAQVHDISLGMALLQLDGDLVDVGPAHLTCRASCCGSPPAARR